MGNLGNEDFLLLSRIVDVSVMHAALEQSRGKKLAGDKYVVVPGSVSDEQLVEQFAYFCKHPPKQSDTEADQPPASKQTGATSP